ncbi:class A beta-lactamase-related serine hydrolase [Actinomadura sp. KC345]|uniref:serine hydrolase domain-containing protein n=1 Tax=Actinomadura sp. KC345 TaxID=2530371 RepID=UPI00104BE5A4|nr:serine hydrolase domain-containing protein [Actinomadura sp. KC345]TDC58736.1 class A beta-lactamase-related serine hydrolase [Actinomadura sp. KC345]
MTHSADPEHAKVQEVLNRAVAEEGVPGIVAEVHDESGTWFGSAGFADLRTGRRRTPEDRFHTGSSGKAFTAATMLQLEAEGKLSIEDTLDQWLPGLTEGTAYDGGAITVRHLLNATSGLHTVNIHPELISRYHTRSGLTEHILDPWQIEELLAMAVARPPEAAPGEKFIYNNGGFHLAGAIIERATGNSYADEVERTVLRPLGLTDTYVRPPEEIRIQGLHPKAYTKWFFDADPAEVTAENATSLPMEDPALAPFDATDFNTSHYWAAGNIISTTGDVIRGYRALASGSLLPSPQHQKMWTTRSNKGSAWITHWDLRYGLGVFEQKLASGLLLRGVGGGHHGSFTYVMGTPCGDHTISIHTNNDWKHFDLFGEILEAEFGSPPAPGH